MVNFSGQTPFTRDTGWSVSQPSFIWREFLLILVLSRFECKICEWKLLFFLCFSAGVLLKSSLYSVKEGWLLYCYACACVFQMHDVHVPQARRSLMRKWRRFAPIYARPRNNWRHLYPFTSGLSVCVCVRVHLSLAVPWGVQIWSNKKRFCHRVMSSGAVWKFEVAIPGSPSLIVIVLMLWSLWT